MSKQNGQTKIFDMVTERIIKLLEAGTVPWKMPWVSGGRNGSVNWVTQRPYRGINQLLLPFGGEYATKKQILDNGGWIKREELKNYHIIVFCRPVTKKVDDAEGEETNEVKRYFLYRYHQVYEINTQCEGLKSKRSPIEQFDHDPILSAETIIDGFINKPEIVYASGRAVYNSFFDRVSVPPLKDYKFAEEYYCTLFHELVHSTGHKSRLNRDGITKNKGFRSDPYAFEELVAEIGATMLCTDAGIENSTIENSASYISSWLQRLKNDNKLIILAARHAQRAFDHILNITFDDEQTA